MKEKIENYHAHIYFVPSQLDLVHDLVGLVRDRFGFDIGKIWEKPVGPHPIGSCQITVPKDRIGKFIPWMMEARRELDIFVHANTGYDYVDHTQYVMWLGKSYEINIGMFES